MTTPSVSQRLSSCLARSLVKGLELISWHYTNTIFILIMCRGRFAEAVVGLGFS